MPCRVVNHTAPNPTTTGTASTPRSCNQSHRVFDGRLKPVQSQLNWYPPIGQSHLIFGTGSTGSATTRLLSKPCCTNALYKPLENLDAIALPGGLCTPLRLPLYAIL